MRLKLTLNNLSVHETGAQPNNELTQTPLPYSEVVRRLKLTCAAIDFLLGHPDLKPSDMPLGLQVLRQTVLFGKESDKITARQQAHGIRNLNRGTGCHPKTLQRARARLRKAGYMRVFCEPGDRRGNTYSPDFDHICAEVQKLRRQEQNAPGYPGANCSPHQSYPSGSNDQNEKLAARSPDVVPMTEPASPQLKPPLPMRPKSDCAPWKHVPAPLDHEQECMRARLRDIAEAFPRADFGSLNRTTARDVLCAARLTSTCCQASPDDVAAFLAWKLQRKRPWPYQNGIRTFGGIIRVVADEFGDWWHRHKRRPAEAEATHSCDSEPGIDHISSPRYDERSSEAFSAQTEKGQQGPLPQRATTELDSFADSPTEFVARADPRRETSRDACEICSDKGYRLDDNGTEQIAGEEFRTITAVRCNCSFGRGISYLRLAKIEQREALHRGRGWVPAHRPVDNLLDGFARDREAVSRPTTVWADYAAPES